MSEIEKIQKAIAWAKEYIEAGTWKQDFRPYLMQQLMKVAEEKQQREWIHVSERLPKEDEEVLITLAHGTVAWAWLYLGEWNTLMQKWPQDCVIAWQPLPEPYKEAKP